LADAANRLADGREDITGALNGLLSATQELTRQVEADRVEYDHRLAEAKARTEQVAEDAAPRVEVASQVRGTRRRIVVAALLLLTILGGVASTGLVLVMRSRDLAATRTQFDQLAQERAANCQVSQVRTATEVAFVRGELAADQASLALLTGPRASDATKAFAHTVFDGRISAEQMFLRGYPAAPLTCTVPQR